ncbi:MAG: hypothetical protein QXV16_00915 [Candidatus Anstonellales archaeon]
MIKTSDGKMVAKAEICNYCGRVVEISKIKSSKNTNDVMIKKINICKNCWSNNQYRKMFKNNKVIHLSLSLF